ncbi:hypothetical protein BDR04DRAFT_1105530 [Suillus decipiens]|nr:hypothetical protein BDR04DRAFT_1105530 [Suillus decipiens]
MATKRINNYTFNCDRMISFGGDTGPYLQYAPPRLTSMERNKSRTHPSAAPIPDRHFLSCFLPTCTLHRYPSGILPRHREDCIQDARAQWRSDFCFSPGSRDFKRLGDARSGRRHGKDSRKVFALPLCQTCVGCCDAAYEHQAFGGDVAGISLCAQLNRLMQNT